MPHMKFFKEIGDISRHYEDMLRAFENERYGKGLLETWGVSWEERELVFEELKVLEYLICCQRGVSFNRDVHKPSIELVNRCFQRHLRFLETVHDCHQWNVNKHPFKDIVREYKACRHYSFKFSCPGWVKFLPDTILAFKSKFPINK